MRLLIINGSPKSTNSNTKIMTDALVSGFTPANKSMNSKTHKQGIFTDVVEKNVLSNAKVDLAEILDYIKISDHILIAFPLYGNSVPACLLELLEEIDGIEFILSKKNISFLIQYGFPEAIHARPIEAFLEEWTMLQGANYMGSIVKGGCDGLYKEMKKNENKGKNAYKEKNKILKGIREIGSHFNMTGQLNKEQLNNYAGTESHRQVPKKVMRVVVWVMNKMYWKKLLSKNNVSEEGSYAKPFGNF